MRRALALLSAATVGALGATCEMTVSTAKPTAKAVAAPTIPRLRVGPRQIQAAHAGTTMVVAPAITLLSPTRMTKTW